MNSEAIWNGLGQSKIESFLKTQGFSKSWAACLWKALPQKLKESFELYMRAKPGPASEGKPGKGGAT